MRVAPALGVDALGVGTHVEEVGPLRVAEGGGVPGPGDVRLAAIAELQLGSLAAIWTID
jgi:hypothetical protein